MPAALREGGWIAGEGPRSWIGGGEGLASVTLGRCLCKRAGGGVLLIQQPPAPGLSQSWPCQSEPVLPAVQTSGHLPGAASLWTRSSLRSV